MNTMTGSFTNKPCSELWSLGVWIQTTRNKVCVLSLTKGIIIITIHIIRHSSPPTMLLLHRQQCRHLLIQPGHFSHMM